MLPYFYDWWDMLVVGTFLAVVFTCGAFWALVLSDCIRSPQLKTREKVGWLVLIVATQIVGAAVFYQKIHLAGPRYRFTLRAIVVSVVLLVMIGFLTTQRH
jgi:hypothetical protein